MLLAFQGCVGDYCCFAKISDAVDPYCENADTDLDGVIDEEQPTDEEACRTYGGTWNSGSNEDYMYLEDECYLFKGVCESQCDGLCLGGQFHD